MSEWTKSGLCHKKTKDRSWDSIDVFYIKEKKGFVCLWCRQEIKMDNRELVESAMRKLEKNIEKQKEENARSHDYGKELIDNMEEALALCGFHLRGE